MAVLASAAVCGLAAVLSYPAHEPAVRAVAGSATGRVLAPLADPLLLLLVGVTGVLVIVTWLRNRQRFWILAAAGAGTIVAYLLNDLVKSLVREERPCREVVLDAALACPEPGSWSWPSNHSVIAASFAVACLLIVPRLTWLTVPLALLTAASRVGGGVHYVHDVATGLCLGALVVLVFVVALRPLAARLSRRT
ncbi:MULTISPECIES: phosphatase PAP2 family protein [Brevibacterium]|uniref:Phosphatidic acid phosphatase type 2/haloperoxidase domain-containing protein n=1 Tax=Brevibacterium salitolerans TaxID=1403566 RepID=A0ABP5IRJ5_9MICO|nr:phosphatase PAP2 family protein [Brevibacterium sp.]